MKGMRMTSNNKKNPPNPNSLEGAIKEIYQKKKSRNQWLQEGERNTKFFHNTVIQNRQRLKIHKLRKTDGGQVETRGEIE